MKTGDSDKQCTLKLFVELPTRLHNTSVVEVFKNFVSKIMYEFVVTFESPHVVLSTLKSVSEFESRVITSTIEKHIRSYFKKDCCSIASTNEDNLVRIVNISL